MVHAPYVDKYVANSYFSKHDNLVDSNFEDFIAHDILSSACVTLQGNVKFAPKLTVLHQKLIGEGSHRRLSSSLRLKRSSESISSPPKSCEVIIVERLPSGVFADPFELQHLVQRGVFRDAAVFGDTNLQLPSFLSNRSLVEVHVEVGTNLTSQQKHGLEMHMELPLHTRYQPLGHGFSRVEFASPDLFLRCNVEGKQHVTSCLFPLDKQNAKPNDGHPVWEVPCGNREHTEIVSALTFISAVVSALLIIVASLRVAAVALHYCYETLLKQCLTGSTLLVKDRVFLLQEAARLKYFLVQLGLLVACLAKVGHLNELGLITIGILLSLTKWAKQIVAQPSDGVATNSNFGSGALFSVF
ncbi:hypothetical protein K7X08_025686 [Anisodus acutangulus]|uniref:Uncharacterized protein n=1 Tax=Anisodus acutangulus TaxID=402998 RepID=A0A9Q1R619_9SOLA|nr:hypothetical protein K7X08_025686 [Anisodus acutangulus]